MRNVAVSSRDRRLGPDEIMDVPFADSFAKVATDGLAGVVTDRCRGVAMDASAVDELLAWVSMSLEN